MTQRNVRACGRAGVRAGVNTHACATEGDRPTHQRYDFKWTVSTTGKFELMLFPLLICQPSPTSCPTGLLTDVMSSTSTT